MFKQCKEDIQAVKERDPAARSSLSIILNYPGVQALWQHRIEHWLWSHGRKGISRFLSQMTRFFTGIEIHPAATLGSKVVIDHGMGVVIGETSVVGDYCTIYQGVTLGGTGKDKGKRHPTIGDHVLIGAGAKVLGPFTVGDYSKIAANAVVLSEVPPNCTAVGVPAKIVKRDGIKITDDLDQINIPNPVATELNCLQEQINAIIANLNLNK